MNFKLKLLAVFVTVSSFIACNDNKTETAKTETVTNNMKTDSVTGNMKEMKMSGGMMASMNTMMEKMSSMKMSGDFDMDFANMMIEHHQGAIDMSKEELANGTDETIKTMARNIITKQTADIGMLREMVQTGKPSGMKHGEGTMEKMHAEMKAQMPGMQMSGNTDKDFANMMIAHHEGGMKMSKALLANGMNNNLKVMAKKSISGETKEISEFKVWLAANK